MSRQIMQPTEGALVCGGLATVYTCARENSSLRFETDNKTDKTLSSICEGQRWHEYEPITKQWKCRSKERIRIPPRDRKISLYS